MKTQKERSIRMIQVMVAIAGVGLLLFGASFARSYAGQKPAGQSLSVDEVVARMVRMNLARAEALRSYTSVREYHLELNGIIHKRADMAVKMTYHWPDQKEFTIISESGSEIMRSRVLKALLDAEKEAIQNENREKTALNAQNYEFALMSVEGSPQPKSYVLRASPKIKNKYLFNGKIWVDAQDFAVVRIEAEPAKNPSWWTKKNDITYSYQKLADFWLPARSQTVTDVRIFGRTVLNIEYKDYQLIETRQVQADFPGRDSLVSPETSNSASSR